MTCDQIQAGETIERYVRRELAPAEQEAFELHYFGCARCFEEVRTVIGARHALVGNLPEVRALRRWPDWYTGAAAAAVLLTVSGLIWFLRPERVKTGPVQAPLNVSQPAPVLPVPGVRPRVQPQTEELQLLARFEPPAYTAPVLRGPELENADLFDKAMKLYTAHSYREAIPALSEAARERSGVPRLQADFYLAVCELIEKRPRQATAALGDIISAGDSAYLEEAHFYQAKAYLQMNRPADAERELSLTIKSGDNMEQKARLLLRKVQKLRRLSWR